MTRAVVDASVVLNLLIDDRLDDYEVVARYGSLHAPSHLDVECLSGLRGQHHRGGLSTTEYVELALLIPDMPIMRHAIDALVPRILVLSANATPYDASYLALAEALDADLLTADARLAAVPGVGCRVTVT